MVTGPRLVRLTSMFAPNTPCLTRSPPIRPARSVSSFSYRAFATADLMGDLLSIVDDFDRALEHADPESDIAIGVNGIRKNLMKVLESKGLKEIDATGKFDPNYHEALCTVEAETEGDVAEVFQKGYCIGNRVLRYTKVKVTKKKE